MVHILLEKKAVSGLVGLAVVIAAVLFVLGVQTGVLMEFDDSWSQADEARESLDATASE